MFFRFIATLTILTGISIYGMSLEKKNLKLKRQISEQHYLIHDLEESRSRLYLKTQQLGAPPRLLRDWKATDRYLVRSDEREQRAGESQSPPPLLQWRLQQDSTVER